MENSNLNDIDNSDSISETDNAPTAKWSRNAYAKLTKTHVRQCTVFLGSKTFTTSACFRPAPL
jgi:hypothetical protein